MTADFPSTSGNLTLIHGFAHSQHHLHDTLFRRRGHAPRHLALPAQVTPELLLVRECPVGEADHVNHHASLAILPVSPQKDAGIHNEILEHTLPHLQQPRDRKGFGHKETGALTVLHRKGTCLGQYPRKYGGSVFLTAAPDQGDVGLPHSYTPMGSDCDAPRPKYKEIQGETVQRRSLLDATPWEFHIPLHYFSLKTPHRSHFSWLPTRCRHLHTLSGGHSSVVCPDPPDIGGVHLTLNEGVAC